MHLPQGHKHLEILQKPSLGTSKEAHLSRLVWCLEVFGLRSRIATSPYGRGYLEDMRKEREIRRPSQPQSESSGPPRRAHAYNLPGAAFGLKQAPRAFEQDLQGPFPLHRSLRHIGVSKLAHGGQSSASSSSSGGRP